DSATPLVLELSIAAANAATPSTSAIVDMEYDARLVEIFRAGQNLAATRNRPQDRTVTLRPGVPTTLAYEVRAIREAEQPTQLKVLVRAGDRTEARDIQLELPAPEAVAVGVIAAVPGTLDDRGKKGLVLEPFPRGLTAYTFYLENRSGKPLDEVQLHLLRV